MHITIYLCFKQQLNETDVLMDFFERKWKITISEPSWANPQWLPPRWAWALCPSASKTKRGRSRRMWCADQPLWTPGWTSPRICCTCSADGLPAQPPSCGEDPWYVQCEIRTSTQGWCTDSGVTVLAELEFCWLFGGSVSQPAARLSCQFPPVCVCAISNGLYSRLMNLFAFGTVQTGPLTFTPLRPLLLKSIISEIGHHPSDRLQISRNPFFSGPWTTIDVCPEPVLIASEINFCILAHNLPSVFVAMGGAVYHFPTWPCDQV